MFRFTIRELTLLTLVVALALGWSLDHWHQAERYKRLHYAVVNSTGRGYILFDSNGEVIVSQYYPNPPPR